MESEPAGRWGTARDAGRGPIISSTTGGRAGRAGAKEAGWLIVCFILNFVSLCVFTHHCCLLQCYCHYCNPDVDVRYGAARRGEVSSLANGPREVDFKLSKLHLAIDRDGNRCSGAPRPHSQNRGDKGRGLETNPGGRGREGRGQGNGAEVVVPKGDKGPPQDREETGVARRKVAVYKDKR